MVLDGRQHATDRVGPRAHPRLGALAGGEVRQVDRVEQFQPLALTGDGVNDAEVAPVLLARWRSTASPAA